MHVHRLSAPTHGLALARPRFRNEDYTSTPDQENYGVLLRHVQNTPPLVRTDFPIYKTTDAYTFLGHSYEVTLWYTPTANQLRLEYRKVQPARTFKPYKDWRPGRKKTVRKAINTPPNFRVVRFDLPSCRPGSAAVFELGDRSIITIDGVTDDDRNFVRHYANWLRTRETRP